MAERTSRSSWPVVLCYIAAFVFGGDLLLYWAAHYFGGVAQGDMSDTETLIGKIFSGGMAIAILLVCTYCVVVWRRLRSEKRS